MSTATTQTPTLEGQVINIPLSKIKLITDPSHPLYDKRAKEKPSAEFVNNLRTEGQKQNITVVEDVSDPGTYLVADGRQRTLAAEILDWETISAKVDPATGDLAWMELMIELNEHRKDDGPVRKAIKLKRYWEQMEKDNLEKFGEGEEIVPLSDKAKVEAAMALFGVKSQQIGNYSLLAYNASPKVLKACETGKINGTIAYKIVGKFPDSHEKQERLLVKLLTDKKDKPSSNNISILGERAIKAKELVELSDFVSVPKQLRDIFRFFAGKATEEEKTAVMAKNTWLAEYLNQDDTVESEEEEE